MIKINLLPWRTALNVRWPKQLVYGCIVAVILIMTSIVYLEWHARQRIAQQQARNQQLEQHVQQLNTLLRKQRLKHRAVSHAVLSADQDQTNLPLHTHLIQINYAKANDLALILKDKTNPFLSERGTLAADARTNMIWVQDTVDRIQKIKLLLQQLDVPNRQVLIEARLVNMSKECANDLGIRFGLLHAVETPDNGALTNNPSFPAGRFNIDLGALPLDATPASIGIAVATLGQHALLDMELSALESEGRAEIIASPRLLTTNQEAAIIESGEDIPYQEYTASGATSVSFKKAVLSLKVIPQITADGKLMMALSINQDSDSGRRVQGVPIILTKSIETNVLVNNGQTIVLGGIYKQDKNNSIARVPFLGKLPIVGSLFRRKQVRVRHDELLIFITPKISGLH